MLKTRHRWSRDFRINVQPKFAQQLHIGLRGRVFGGEKLVAVENAVRAREETECLALPGEPGPPGGKTDAGFRKSEACDGD